MTLESDVRRLESELGMGGPESEYCTCPSSPENIEVVWEGIDPELDEPQICPVCGQPCKRIVITWEGKES